MRRRGLNQPSRQRAVLGCLGILLLTAMATTADARTRQHRHAGVFKVALQPFSMARARIHSIAEAVVHSPRPIIAMGTTPIRAPYRPIRSVSREKVYEASAYEESSADEGYDDDEGASIYQSQRARTAEPIRVAYVTSRARSAAPPGRDAADEDYDQEQAAEESSTLQSTGSKPMVNGSHAVLRNGIAYAPSHAPQRVKNAIWAANTLRRKPYVWGGGHGSFSDRGYDCSGTVSFALHGAGALSAPLPSGDFMRYGERGRGRWITIYSRRGHTFAMIAGLRLDTTDFERGSNTGPRWHADGRDTGGYVARHPAGM